MPSHAIQHLHVPFYDNLTTDLIMEFLQKYPEVFQYLPDEVELPKLPKQYLINVAYAIVQDDFSKWVKGQIEARNKKVAVEKNLLIEMDPEVAEAFAASNAVSRKFKISS